MTAGKTAQLTARSDPRVRVKGLSQRLVRAVSISIRNAGQRRNSLRQHKNLILPSFNFDLDRCLLERFKRRHKQQASTAAPQVSVFVLLY